MKPRERGRGRKRSGQRGARWNNHRRFSRPVRPQMDGWEQIANILQRNIRNPDDDTAFVGIRVSEVAFHQDRKCVLYTVKSPHVQVELELDDVSEEEVQRFRDEQFPHPELHESLFGCEGSNSVDMLLAERSFIRHLSQKLSRFPAPDWRFTCTIAENYRSWALKRLAESINVESVDESQREQFQYAAAICLESIKPTHGLLESNPGGSLLIYGDSEALNSILPQLSFERDAKLALIPLNENTLTKGSEFVRHHIKQGLGMEVETCYKDKPNADRIDFSLRGLDNDLVRDEILHSNNLSFVVILECKHTYTMASLPGGTRQMGESSWKCAERETKEELMNFPMDRLFVKAFIPYPTEKAIIWISKLEESS